MNGSHWVTTYVKDFVINYFDSFGMPPFQAIVDHAKKEEFNIAPSKQPDSEYKNYYMRVLRFILSE